jgi:hypothetical protein
VQSDSPHDSGTTPDTDTCDTCGKNGTDRAHGAIDDPRNPLKTLPPLSCGEVNEIRARVAVDLTRQAMNPVQRFTSWVQRRSGEYTDIAYQAAWAAPAAKQAEGRTR